MVKGRARDACVWGGVEETEQLLFCKLFTFFFFFLEKSKNKKKERDAGRHTYLAM